MTRRREAYVFAKNAVANVARGGAASIVALLLPPFLTRFMAKDAFAAWSLVLQLGAYVGYFDFGIQTAISRFVAHSTERGDLDYRNRIVSSAFAMLALSGGLAFVAMLILVGILPHIFHQLHGALVGQVRLALLLVGGSLAISLPSSAFAALFVGLQRNEIPAAIVSVPRLIGAVLVVLVVRSGGGLPAMAMVTAGVNLTAFFLQYLAYRRWIPNLTLSPSFVSRAVIRDLMDYCVSLTVWSLGLLLVTGLDLTIVGAFRFREVGYYAVAATLVTFFNGLFGALYGAMGAPAAVLHARDDAAGLGRMVATATRVGMLLLLAVGVPLIVWARPIMTLWVGADYAQKAAPILQLLVAANIVRICVSPYIIAMISTGEQRRIILVPMLEGVVNLSASLIAGYYLGAIGVAIGTLIGAFVNTGGHALYTMRHSKGIALNTSDYVRDSMLRPLLSAVPVFLLAALWSTLSRVSPPWGPPLWSVLAAACSVFLLWNFGLSREEREKLLVRLSLR